MRRWLMGLGFLLAASPLAGQSLVGRWSSETPAVNRQTGEMVMLRADIEFRADSTFVASLSSMDGSEVAGRSAITRGTYRTITDPWGGRMICVLRDDRREPAHCQNYRFTEAALEWGGIRFIRDHALQPS